MNLYQKLHDIQSKIIGLGKDAKSNSYGYVSGAKVLEHVKPLMNQHKLILKQEILSIENERQDYRTGYGGNYEKPKHEILSKVMMRFTWIDTESGEKDENLFGANGQNDWDKGVGSALTYAERYFLLKFFHIATDEDDIDNPDRKPDEKPAQPLSSPAPQPLKPSAATVQKPASAEQVTMAKDLWEKMKMKDACKLVKLVEKHRLSPERRIENLGNIDANLLIVDLQQLLK